MILHREIVITGSSHGTVTAEKDYGEHLLVIRDPRLACVSAENWRRHAHHSLPCRRTVPWRAYIRVGWGSRAGRRRKQLGSETGADG